MKKYYNLIRLLCVLSFTSIAQASDLQDYTSMKTGELVTVSATTKRIVVRHNQDVVLTPDHPGLDSIVVMADYTYTERPQFLDTLKMTDESGSNPEAVLIIVF